MEENQNLLAQLGLTGNEGIAAVSQLIQSPPPHVHIHSNHVFFFFA